MAFKTNTDSNDEDLLLPLHRLMIKLRQHGFVIRPNDYIEILKVVETFGPANPDISAPLLCPLIATSPEEQERFYKVFDEYKKTSPTPPPVDDRWFVRFGRWIKKRKWWLLTSFFILCGIAAWFFLSHKPILQLTGNLFPEKISEGDGAYRVGDTVRLEASAAWAPSVATDSSARYFWNTSNGFTVGGPVLTTVLAREGRMNVSLKIRTDNFNPKDSLATAAFFVCARAPKVRFSLNKTGYEKGDKLIVQTAIDTADAPPFSRIVWELNGMKKTAEKDGSFSTVLDTAGVYRLAFTGYIRSAGNGDSLCPYVKTFDDIIVTDNRYLLQVTSSGKPLLSPLQKRLHPMLNWLLLIPALLIGLGTLLWWNRKRGANKKKGEEAPPQFRGHKPPYETPFENRDTRLAVTESPLREIFRSFRQKAEDEFLAFDVRQSIRQTIRSGGLPELVFSAKQRYADYVILIDGNLARSMQVRLFDYLVNLLNNEAVNVERFYFTGAFEKIFNEASPDGYTLKRLAELYKNYTLIVMGSGAQLIYGAYNVLDKQLASVLNEWEYKAILTPVPYKDWEEKEALLAQKFILLPADLQGQLKLIQAIREKSLHHGKYLSSIEFFYEAEPYDFRTVEDIKAYLDGDLLFQWLCAAAVYHKLRWEIVIEVGKAICTQCGQPEKLNFTNLLKLSRIRWMNEGSFPAEVRLELLKELKPQAEMLARETLLRMLQYAETFFGGDYFFEEEKEVQKITSRFLLYAADPEKYSAYAADGQKFKALWESGKHWDAPQIAYLENPDGRWSTLLQGKNKIAGISQYFQFRKLEGLRAERKLLWRNGIIAAMFVLLLGLFHLFATALPPGSLLLKASEAKAVLTITVADSVTCEGGQILKALHGTLRTGAGKEFDLPFANGSTESVILQATDVTDNNGFLEISGDNGQRLTATSLVKLSSDSLHITVSACSISPAYVVNIVCTDSSRAAEVQSIADFLAAQGYRVNSVSYEKLDSASCVFYFSSADAAGADSLAQLLSYRFGDIFPQAQTIETNLDFGKKKALGLLINFDPPGNGWKLSKLPNRVNEIWQGGTTNRLLAISDPLMYYSTGDKRTYGTYRIDEVWENTGTYKVITRAGNQYQLFFIRGVQPKGFELSVCQNRYNTKEEAEVITESYCDHFNAMALYYERDTGKIFLPVNSKQIEGSNQDKIDRINDRVVGIRNRAMVLVDLTGTLFINSEFRLPVLKTLAVQYSSTIALRSPTPFDRNYLKYTISLARDGTVPDCNRTFNSLREASGVDTRLVCKLNLSGQNLSAIPKEVYVFTNLQELDLRKNSIAEAEIKRFQSAMPTVKVLYDQTNVVATPERLLAGLSMDAKGYPDSKAQNVLKQIVAYLNENTTAKARLVFYYTGEANRKFSEQWMANTQTYLGGLKYNANNLKIELTQPKDDPYQQQQRQGIWAEISGTKFPNSFLQTTTSD